MGRGADGLIPHHDGFRLTRCQRQVVTLLASGLTVKQIALQLGVTPWMVYRHISKVMDKLHVDTHAGLVVSALKIGWLHLDAIQVQHADRRG
jgi:DNA-binding NarL/FixJ family response regulator